MVWMVLALNALVVDELIYARLYSDFSKSPLAVPGSYSVAEECRAADEGSHSVLASRNRKLHLASISASMTAA